MRDKQEEAQAWHAIREEVFIKEQGFQNEFDEIDEIAEHIVLYSEDDPVGCGRIYPDQKKQGIWHLGRVAIRKPYRKCGYGKVILGALEIQAKDLGAMTMQLSAQVQAIPFYEICGYHTIGEEYMDEHVPHRTMQKIL